MAKRSDAGPIALDDLESAGVLVLACKTCTVSKDLIPTPLRGNWVSSKWNERSLTSYLHVNASGDISL